VMGYEHRQIGHVVIWALLGASVLVLGRTDFSGVAPVRELSRPSRRVSNCNCVVLQTRNQN
jgi:hypothetical protein